MIEVYQYPKCSTCRKALKWLDERGVEYRSIDITQKPPSTAKLKRALTVGGLEVRQLFNTSGQSYREGNFKERLASMNTSDALAALAADGKLIKRPLVFADDAVLVGFDAQAYGRHFY